MLERLWHDLQALWLERHRDVAQRYRRALPFGDYVVDRWEKAKALGFGDGTSIYDSVLVLGDVRVADNTWIGPFVVLDGSGGLTIGSHCTISAGVQIYSHDTVQWALSGGSAPYEYAATSVGDNCFIGPSTIVARGVRIGSRCRVGANSLVLADIPDGSIAHGTPCRIVGRVPPMQSAGGR